MESNGEIIHYGVLGMRWGRRRRLSAARAADRDAASLKRAGYKKESEAVKKNATKLRKEARKLTGRISEQRTRDAKTRKNLKNKDSWKVLGKAGLKVSVLSAVVSATLTTALGGNSRQVAESALKSAGIAAVLNTAIGSYNIAKTGTPTKPRS